MTAINDLRRRALIRPAPAEVTITWNHVGGLIDHIIACSFFPSFPPITRADIQRDLILGKARICAVPIRVLGVPAHIRANAERTA